jgi:hypothetical protein
MICSLIPTSTIAAHSIALPLAIAKNLFISGFEFFPTPSAMLRGILIEAR